MSSQPNALAILEAAGAIITNNHFVLTSGLHSPTYVNCKPKNMRVPDVSALCAMIAEQHINDHIDVVVGPAEGGVLIAELVAGHLSRMGGVNVPSIPADKDGNGGFVFTHGDELLVKGRRILVVEDVLTTGGSAKKVVDLIHAHGGEIVAVSAFVNRGRVLALDLRFSTLNALVEIDVPSWTEAECQASHMCSAGVPVNTVLGHGAKYLAGKLPT